jgi:hypothetical protein
MDTSSENSTRCGAMEIAATRRTCWLSAGPRAPRAGAAQAFSPRGSGPARRRYSTRAVPASGFIRFSPCRALGPMPYPPRERAIKWQESHRRELARARPPDARLSRALQSRCRDLPEDDHFLTERSFSEPRFARLRPPSVQVRARRARQGSPGTGPALRAGRRSPAASCRRPISSRRLACAWSAVPSPRGAAHRQARRSGRSVSDMNATPCR